MAEDPSGIRPLKTVRSTSHGSRRVVVTYRSLGAAAVVIALCVLSFLGGVAYQHSKQPTTAATSTKGLQNGRGFGGFGGFGGRRNFANRSFGQVTAISSSSITVQNQAAGTTKTYSITSNTQVSNNGQVASASDIQVGDQVVVVASTSNTDEAARIVVSPAFGTPGSGSLQTQSAQ